MEFEFEEEPEINADSNELFIPLKFAPIRIQETPTNFSYEATVEKRGESSESGNAAGFKSLTNSIQSGGNIPRLETPNSIDREENETAVIRSLHDLQIDNHEKLNNFGFTDNVLEAGSRDEEFKFEYEQPVKESAVAAYEKTNDHCSLESDPCSPKSDPQECSPLASPDLYSGGKYLNDFETQIEMKGTENAPTILQLPDRSLAKSRYCITDYEKTQLTNESRDDFTHKKTGLTRPLRPVTFDKDEQNKNGDHQDPFRSTFNKLRSVFEYERPETPRTEYLSEIIKKNTDGGRRRNQMNSAADLDVKSNNINNFERRKAVRDCTNDKVNSGEDLDNGFGGYQASIAESDLSSVDDFDFSSISPRVPVSLILITPYLLAYK